MQEVVIVQDKTKTGNSFYRLINLIIFPAVLWASLRLFACPPDFVPYVKYLIGVLILTAAVKFVVMVVLAGSCFEIHC
ncbi:MAG: hypothetical protein LBQ54_01925 [Planctomycetaceae bacterium]|jgi:hypothetical protein|nr:hypothetical protein [Planctomycetaceae bacterium]